MTDIVATFLASLGGDDSSVSDGLDEDTGLRAGGHRTRFVAALKQFVAICAYVIPICQNAVVAALGGNSLTGTSITSLAMGLGAKTFTMQMGKSVFVGMPGILAYAGDPTIQMAGIVTAYNSGSGVATLSVSSATALTGTYANWQFGPGTPSQAQGVHQVGVDQVVSSPVATVDFNNGGSALGTLPASELYIELVGISQAVNSQALQISTSVNGVTFSTPKSISIALLSASSYDGAIQFPNVKVEKILGIVSLDVANTAVSIDNAADVVSGTGSKTFVLHRDTLLHTIRLSPASGSFDAGTFRLYRRV